jgi:hypothetical protein
LAHLAFIGSGDRSHHDFGITNRRLCGVSTASSIQNQAKGEHWESGDKAHGKTPKPKNHA